MNPRVTWIMPVLNGMPYLAETLASIERQTFNDFEVLVWDNGSTDGTLDLLGEWIPKRLPGRVVSGRPMSLAASLAQAVTMAKSPLLARIDADDVCMPNRLECQVAYLKDSPESVLVGSQVERISGAGVNSGPYHLLPTEHEDIVIRLMRKWAIWHPTVLMRREAVLVAGNYQEEVAVEDYGLWLRLARIGRLANLPNCLVQYRVHETSVTEIEIKTGRLSGRIAECLARNGPPLYGLNKEEMVAINTGAVLSCSQFNRVIRHLQSLHCRKVKLLARLLICEGRNTIRRKIHSFLH